MAGIYIHIPFCKKACHYCNFHFSTSMGQKDKMVDAIIKEIKMRSEYLDGLIVETIYFGGGTPSVLSSDEIRKIVHACKSSNKIADNIELTLEANPDDLTSDKLLSFYDAGINRLSIGIQSFQESDLTWMNRSHNADQARRCIEDSFKIGISNFSIDLIFGSPTTTNEVWASNLRIAESYGIKHISCYALTVEEDTALNHFIKNKKVKPLDESIAEIQFSMTMETLENCGYEHYEISNYCKPGYRSKHNTNYWNRVPYIGVGPSAHSYNGLERSWNIAHNAKYLTEIEKDFLPQTKELLSSSDIYNEYIMTGLRTSSGIDLSHIIFESSGFMEHFIKEVEPYIEKEVVKNNNNIFTISKNAWIMSDKIISDLFI